MARTGDGEKPKGEAVPEATMAATGKRAYISQEDVPAYPLEQALRVARAIAENYAYKPTRPLNVAGAMKVSPGSGGFRGLTGASLAYGLTTGGAYSSEIGITPLGLRIVRPTKEGDDLAARREALLKPKVVGDFLRQYDGAAVPADGIAKNVLEEKGVPAGRTSEVLELIISSAEAVGFLKEISGKRYVDLAGADIARSDESPGDRTGEGEPRRGIQTVVRREAGSDRSPAVTVGGGVHINIEIHIAADAASETIEEIFKNMRRYVLSDPDAEPDDRRGASADAATDER